MKKPYSLLVEGDCLEVMSYMPDNSVNLVLCDLPYGTTQNKWDSIIPFDELWKNYKRILKPNGAVLLMSQGVFTAKVILSQERLFKYKITWIKSKATNFLNAKKQPLRKHEDICVFYAKQPKYFPQMSEGSSYNKGVRKEQLTGSYGAFSPSLVQSDGARYPTDTVYFKTAETEGEVWHPTQKPVELGRYLVQTYTEEGDIILDNCFGSASFLVAAALEKRNAIGIELNQDIVKFKDETIDLFDIAGKRLSGIANVQSTDNNANLSDLFQDFMRKIDNSKLSQKSNARYRSSLSRYDQINSDSPMLAL
ncbi:DNA-methyltransferase [Pasteurella multocida]|uniref:DNA-methyltransferase n=1 Tax=Pasteurella multocida TaxID=747 RepID=UPI0008FACEA4|nr:site-specific DNA-methyltransferase [Pasteurella multocida]MDC4235632.1 site-specific DNA-methyltransferase [Pasteurella multocida]